MALQYVENQTEEISKLAVQQNGYMLQYVKEQTKELCELAVQRNGQALQFVNDQTKEICKFAVQQDGYALRHEQLCQIMPKVGKNIWLKVVGKKMDQLNINPSIRFVITDVRFSNECQMSNLGGFIIRVKRDCVSNTSDTRFDIIVDALDTYDIKLTAANCSNIIDFLAVDNCSTNCSLGIKSDK